MGAEEDKKGDFSTRKKLSTGAENWQFCCNKNKSFFLWFLCLTYAASKYSKILGFSFTCFKDWITWITPVVALYAGDRIWWNIGQFLLWCEHGSCRKVLGLWRSLCSGNMCNRWSYRCSYPSWLQFCTAATLLRPLASSQKTPQHTKAAARKHQHTTRVADINNVFRVVGSPADFTHNRDMSEVDYVAEISHWLTSNCPVFFWMVWTLLNRAVSLPSTSPHAKLQTHTVIL